MSARVATIEDFAECYSDLYKDAHGFRPRGLNLPTTLEGWQAEYTYLNRVIEESITEDARREAAAFERFDARISDLMTNLGQDRATVLRWLMDAEQVDSTCPQSVAHWYWNQGLASDVRRMALIHDHGFSRRVAGFTA